MYEKIDDTHADCNSKLEYVLLCAGFFDLSPINLFDCHICSNHYQQLTSFKRRNNCNICKLVFGEDKKMTTSTLRSVSKHIAVGLWLDHGISTYNKTICTTCRLKLDKKYNTKENIEKCENIFKWLYNPMIWLTPEKSESTFDDSYHLSNPDPEQTDTFSHCLRDHGFTGRIEKTLSYDALQHHSETKSVLFTTIIKEHLLVIFYLVSLIK